MEQLHAYLKRHGRAASPALDSICNQKDAHTTLIHWFTDLPAAIAEAQRTQRPILSLRLLGRLDEELSCANSRFFRKLLYPEARINRVLRERFVLHWESVRPVPRVTIDFGNGKKLERTLTGNSAHLVLDTYGRPVDALPGLFSADVFLQLLVRAAAFGMADRGRLARMHADAREPLPPPPAPTRAFEASMLARSKHMVEGPTLRGVTPVGSDLDGDTNTNLALHDLVHEAFARRAVGPKIEAFVAWIYRELFLMPPEDPALGLDVADPFSAVA
ncbi:MAG: hypothetical protein ABI175_05585 [Polyangiales bacterium]